MTRYYNKFMIVLVFFIILIPTIYAQTDYDTVYKKAIENINDENYFEAIRLLQSIQDKGDYMLFFNLGYCHYYLDNDEQAQVFLKKAIALKGSFADGYAYLGMSYFFSNKPDEAEKALLRSLRFDNANFKVYYFLGKIYERRKNFHKAIGYYTEALERNDLDFNTNYAMASIYYITEDYRNAKKYFEICDMLDDQIYSVVNSLIRIRYKQNDLGDVEDYKQRLKTIWQNTDDEDINELSRFIIDTFEYEDFFIVAEESFELSGFLYYHWVFRIYDGDGYFVKTVNLESSLGLRQMGTAYIVGTDRFEEDKRIHQTTNIVFTELPDYAEMKKIVIDEIENGLDAGVTGVYPFKD